MGITMLRTVIGALCFASICSISFGQGADQSPKNAPARVPLVGGIGSGFVVHPSGYLVTNHHVVKGKNPNVSVDDAKLEIRVAGKSYTANIVAMNKDQDLALLKIEATKLPSLALADLELQLGEEVRVFGFPLGLALGDSVKVTKGTVSGVQARPSGERILTDTAINPGNSGGPLVSSRGDVVGVVSAKLPPEIGENVGFCIPVDYVKKLLHANEVQAKSNIPVEQNAAGVQLVKRTTPAIALIKLRPRFWTLNAHAKDIDALALSPQGRLLATHSQDAEELKIWNAHTLELRTAIKLRPLSAGVAFRDDRTIAYGDDDRIVFWDVEKREMVHTIQLDTGGLNYVSSLSFSTDGTMLAVGTDENVVFWDLKKGERRVVSLDDHVEFVQFLPNSSLVLSRTHPNRDRKNAKLWDARKGDVVSVLPIARVWDIAPSKDGRLLAVNAGKQSGIWDVQGRRMASFEASEGRFAFLPDNKVLAKEDSTGFALLDVKNGKSTYSARTDFPRIKLPKDRVSAICIHRGDIVITAHRGGAVRFWDWRGKQADTGKPADSPEFK